MGRWASGGATDIGSQVLPQLAKFYSHVHGVTIQESTDAATTNLMTSAAPPLLLLSGNPLSEDHARDLKQYTANGGTLLVNTRAGDQASMDASRKWIEKNFGKLTPLTASHPISVGRMPGGFDLTHGVRYTLSARRTLRAEELDATTHQLEAVVIDGRPVVLFSRFDLASPVAGERILSAAAYRPVSAQRILSNILAYVGEDDA